MAAMDPADFARRFETAYGDIYLLAVRRVRDKRERLSPETTAFLLHLAEAGPMSLTELSPEGQARLADALSVLEQARLEAAAARLPQADRQTLIQLLGDLAAALRKAPP